MKLPALWLALGLTLGVLTASFLHLPLFWIMTGFLITAPFLWMIRGRNSFLPLSVFLIALLGYLHAHAQQGRPPDGIENWTGEGWVRLEGLVSTQPEIQIKGRKETVSFVLSSKDLVRWVKKRREFFETAGDVQVFLFQPVDIPEFGDHVRLSGHLKKPEPVLNPGEFDYGHYLAERNIYAIFEGFGTRSVQILARDKAPPLLKGIFRARQAIGAKIDALFTDLDQSVLLKALTIGSRKGLRPELREDFMKTGTAHLLAISGMNITLSAGTFYFLLIALKFRQKPAAGFALAVVFLHVLIAGMGIPVQRAGWMAGAGFLAILLERERNTLNSFFLAFFILLLTDPGSLTNVSFQLSFLSVFSLIALVPRWVENWRWREVAGDSAVVMAGTFPIVIYYFNIFSPISIVANMAAIPIFHLALLAAVASLAFGSLPVVGFLFIRVTAGLIKTGLLWVHWLGAADWGYWYLPTPSFFQLNLYYASLAALLVLPSAMTAPLPRTSIRLPRWTPALAAGIWLVSASSFFWPGQAPPFQITLLAAGKNELAHLEFSGIHWLINSGRGFPSDQGQWIIAPYLRARGIKRLTGIVVSDFYRRHTGGLKSVLRNFSADYFLYPAFKGSSKFPREVADRRKINQAPLRSGERVRMKQGGEIRVLGTDREQLILHARWQEWDFLFLPALGWEVVEQLKRHRDLLLKVDVLILPSLSVFSEPQFEDLFDLLDPQVATVPAAEAAMMDFLRDRDIPLFDLTQTGALTFSLGESDEDRLEGMEIQSVLKGPLGQLRRVTAK